MNENPYLKVFNPFADLLKERFERFNNKKWTNEDSIRYLFFSSLFTHAGLLPNEIVLEYPYSKYGRKKVDTFVPSIANREGMVVEFKYDRRNGIKKRNKGGTKQAGQLFSDIARLAHFEANDPGIYRYFIYVTDGHMQKYLKNPNNGLDWFFNAEKDQNISLDSERLNKLANSFRKNASEIVTGTVIKLVYGADLSNDHVLRIYEITTGKHQ